MWDDLIDTSKRDRKRLYFLDPTSPSFPCPRNARRRTRCNRYMCVTLWQDFIGSAFLASLGSFTTSAGGTSPGPTSWTLDLHSAAAASKPSPYLPVCMIATKPLSVCGGHDGEEVGDVKSASDGEEGGNGARVAARCDRAGRPLPPGGEPLMLIGETQVRTLSCGGRGGLGSRGHRSSVYTCSIASFPFHRRHDCRTNLLRNVSQDVLSRFCARARQYLACSRFGRWRFAGSQVLMHVREAQQMHRRRFDLREIRPGRFEQVRQ